ncbi:MAG: hypothetical protein ACEPO8_05350 [Rhodothermaceae bacterium]
MENHTNIDELIAAENLPENNIAIPKRIHKYHRLVKKTLDYFKHNIGKEYLNINVSEQKLARAIKIFHTLIIELEKRGHTVEINMAGWNPKTFVNLLGQTLEIRLVEKNKQIKNPKYNDKNWIENKFFLEPTGIFNLKIERIYHTGDILKLSIKDTTKYTVEERLNDFIICLIKASEYERKKKIEIEERNIKKRKMKGIRWQKMNESK